VSAYVGKASFHPRKRIKISCTLLVHRDKASNSASNGGNVQWCRVHGARFSCSVLRKVLVALRAAEAAHQGPHGGQRHNHMLPSPATCTSVWFSLILKSFSKNLVMSRINLEREYE
jgi:hypothetical protein